MAIKEINQTHIQKLKQQRRTIGLLQFKHKEDQNFSKWYSLTENLVIRAFGQKSNQVLQLKGLLNDMISNDDSTYWVTKRLTTRQAQDKLKDLLTVFTSELELDIEVGPKILGNRRTGASINIKNTQTMNQKIDISIEIKNIIQNIKQNEPNPQKANEAELKLKEFETEMKSENPVWSKVKDILIWLLNFSRDAFIQILPILLQKYGLL